MTYAPSGYYDNGILLKSTKHEGLSTLSYYSVLNANNQLDSISEPFNSKLLNNIKGQVMLPGGNVIIAVSLTYEDTTHFKHFSLTASQKENEELALLKLDTNTKEFKYLGRFESNTIPYLGSIRFPLAAIDSESFGLSFMYQSDSLKYRGKGILGGEYINLAVMRMDTAGNIKWAQQTLHNADGSEPLSFPGIGYLNGQLNLALYVHKGSFFYDPITSAKQDNSYILKIDAENGKGISIIPTVRSLVTTHLDETKYYNIVNLGPANSPITIDGKVYMNTTDTNKQLLVLADTAIFNSQSEIENNNYFAYYSAEQNSIISNSKTNNAYSQRLYSLQGKLVYQQAKCFNSSSIPTNNLPKGVYLLELNDGTSLLRKKIVVY